MASKSSSKSSSSISTKASNAVQSLFAGPTLSGVKPTANKSTIGGGTAYVSPTGVTTQVTPNKPNFTTVSGKSVYVAPTSTISTNKKGISTTTTETGKTVAVPKSYAVASYANAYPTQSSASFSPSTSFSSLSSSPASGGGTSAGPGVLSSGASSSYRYGGGNPTISASTLTGNNKFITDTNTLYDDSKIKNILSKTENYPEQKTVDGELRNYYQDGSYTKVGAAPKTDQQIVQDYLYNPESNIDLLGQAQRDSGVQESGAFLSGLRGDIARIQRERDLKIRALDQEPISLGAREGRSREIQAQYAYQLADLAIAEAAATQNYDRARELANDKYDALVNDQKFQLQQRVAQYQQNYDKFTPAQRRIIEGNLNAYGAGIKQLEDDKGILDSEKKKLLDALHSGIDVIPGISKQEQAKRIASATSVSELPYIEGGVTSPEKLQARIDKINTEFQNQPIVKQFNTINESVQTFNSLGNSPTDDIYRVYAFAKVADPNSAVREGEYKTVQDYSTALLQRTGIKVKRVFNNSGFLTAEARNMMQQTLNKRLEASRKNYDSLARQYENRISNTSSNEVTSQLTDYTQGFSNTGVTNSPIIKTKVGDIDPNW